MDQVVATIEETLEERLRLKHVPLPRDKQVESSLRKLARQHLVRKDPTQPVGPTNRGEQDALVITGASGAGKSYTIGRAFTKVPHPFDPGRTINDCVVSVKFPSPFTTKSLANAIIKKLEGSDFDTAGLTDSELWGLVVSRLEERQILFVHFDEFQRFKTERGINSSSQRLESIRRLAETVNYLLTENTWPVALIISGLPEIQTFWRLQVLSQVKRRTKFVDFAQMAEGHDEQFVKVFAEYCLLAKIKNIPNGLEYAGRLRVASSATVGIALEMVQEAVIEATEREGTQLEAMDLASVFAARFPELATSNPFLLIGWREMVMPSPSELAQVFEGEIWNSVPPKATPVRKNREKAEQ